MRPIAVKHILTFAAHDGGTGGNEVMSLWKGAQLAPISPKLVLIVIGAGFCLGFVALSGH